jgi:hypothetical protein
MKRIVWLIALLLMAGCDSSVESRYNTSVSRYNTSVVITKTNGQFVSATVTFPCSDHKVTVCDRADLNQLIQNMEEVLVDLKDVRDHMKVIESKNSTVANSW